jgi:hypothetical protein
MSCNSCNKLVELTDPTKNGLQYSLIAPVPGVVGIDGVLYSLEKPLFPAAKAPRGGWYVEIYFVGHKHRISMKQPHSVAAEVMRLLSLNEILYTSAEVWLNLNVQWIGRAVEKYQKVHVLHLLAISTPNF